MRRLPANQCRRCGERHEESFQLIDNQGRWAMSAVQCTCGHAWTMIHTAPHNLAALRAWVSRGCEPAEGPLMPLRSGPWQAFRLEGLCPEPLAPQRAQA
ncbi:MAG: hypothetical protein ACOY93_19170 [Bacillota bacterium]